MPPVDLQWIEMVDFSPGIFSNNNLAGGISVTSQNPCMAQEIGTVRCRSLPTGGLGPGPRRTFDFALTSVPGAGNDYTYLINGLGTWGQIFNDPIVDTDQDHRIEVHLPISYTTGGTWDNTFKWVRERIFDTTPSTEVILTDTSTDSAPEKVQYGFLMKTRLNPASPLDPGVPVMVCVYGGFAQGLRVSAAHPDPATASTNSTVEVGDDTLLWRRAVAHQGRIMLGQYVLYNRGDDATISTEENMYWTDVNDTSLDDSIAAVFVPEVDSSITDMGSMSANQLIVIKSIGGGYVLQGSLGDVTVVRLPNLMCPDGAETVQGCNTSKGFVYSAGDRGLYIWNGSDQAEWLSSQLDGRTFLEEGGVPFGEGSHRGQCDRWMDLLLAPNLWFCDLETRGWWRLDDPDDDAFHGTPVCWFQSTKYNSQAVGARAILDNDDDEVFYIWDYADLAHDYTWRSHPFWISRDRYITVRQAVVALQGHGQVTIKVMDSSEADANVAYKVIDIDSDEIQNYRFDLSLSSENLIVDIHADGAGSEAPLVHRLYLGYDAEPSHLPNYSNTESS